MTPSLFQRTMVAALRVVLCEVSRVQQGLIISVFKERGQLKASRPLIRVLVINDNGLWINDFI